MFTLLPTAEKVMTRADARRALVELNKSRFIAFDTETTGISRPRDRAIMLSLSSGSNRFSVWPQMIPYFEDLLQDPARLLIAHQANFDAWMLANAGLDIHAYAPRTAGRVYDTLVMSVLVNDSTQNDLKFQTRSHLNIEMQTFGSTFNLGNRKVDLEKLLLDPANEDVVNRYASLDAWTTYHLFNSLAGELRDIPASSPYGNMLRYYEEIELPFTKVLYDMERKGIKIDRKWLLDQAPKIEDDLISVERWFSKKLGRFDFNLKSPQQVSDLFHKTLGYSPRSYTGGGSPQVNDTTLTYWANTKGCEVAEKILEHRDLSKRLTTYIMNLLNSVHTDGRVHPTLLQGGTDTGRLASRDPNAQNQPPWAREAFVAEDGFELLCSDYAQLEMRLMAHLCGDATLCRAIIDGLDIHSSTAAMMYDISYESIAAAKGRDDRGEPLLDGDKALINKRKTSKAIGFGILYGQGARALSESLGIDIDEAKAAIRKFNSKLSAIPKYFNGVIAQARDDGYCTTMFGRRRQLPGVFSPYNGDVAACERQTKNSPIQGSAAEVAKLAMIAIHRNDYIYMSGAEMNLQVHDEVMLEVPLGCRDDKRFNVELSDCMMHSLPQDLRVPLDTSTKYGRTWLDAK